MSLSLTSIVLLALFAQPPGDARDKARAQALLSEGTTLYESGKYLQALEKFNAAYGVYPSPKLWFNIGKANRDLGRPVESLDAFEKFLSDAPDVSIETSNEARAAVDELKRTLGQLRVDCDLPNAEVSVDGKSVGVTPLPAAVWVVAGRHQVVATLPHGKSALASTDVAAAEASSVQLRLREKAPAPAARAPVAAQPIAVEARTPTAQTAQGRTWTWIAAGSTLALAGGAVTMSLLTRSKYNELNQQCGAGSKSHVGCQESAITGVESRQLAANVLWGVTGAAALTSLILFFAEGNGVAVAPMAGDAKGLLARVEF
jgi:tetratricopeptide (TPR) repeat protein